MNSQSEPGGVSWVKAQDSLRMTKVPDSDRRRDEWLASLDPDERAMMEQRIETSARTDVGAFFARVATANALAALRTSLDEGELVALLRAQPPTPAVLFRGMQHDLPLPTHEMTVRGLTIFTLLPWLAMAQPGATARERDLVGRRLTAVAATSGRAAGSISSNPTEQSMLLLPGTVLRPVGRRALGDVEVTLFAEGVPPSPPAGGPGADENLWDQVCVAVNPSAVLEVPSREPNRFYGGEIV